MNLFAPFLAVLVVFQQPPGLAQLPPAPPLLGQSICGKGTLLLKLDGRSVGEEKFEITCRADGYSATGNTQLNLSGASIELTTTLELDKDGLPRNSSAKGTVSGQPFEQTVTIKEHTAVLTSSSGSREIPYSKGAPLLGGNIFFMMQFVLGLYDTHRGGRQELTAFPATRIRLERVARDQVTLSGEKNQEPLDRYDMSIGLSATTVWCDHFGRIVLFAVPAQKFIAVREEYAAVADSLLNLVRLPETEIDYSAPPGAGYTSEEVVVQAKGFSLGGTLLLPKPDKLGKRRFPAVVTITGSGQQTRDERIPLSGLAKYRPFGQVAEALAASGVAVLRVDDRGVGKSGGRETLEKATTADFADDVRAEVEYLRSRSEIDPGRIALIGHSEGGVIAPMVASTDTKVAAIVLMAGTAKRGDQVLAFQYQDALERDPSINADERLDLVEKRRALLKAVAEGSTDASIPEVFKTAWLKFAISYDPLATIRLVKQPILILQGGLDHQVTPDQAPMLEKAARQAGNKDVTVHLFPTLNHLFLPAKTGAPDEYGDLSTTQLSDDLLKIITSWVDKKLGVGR